MTIEDREFRKGNGRPVYVTMRSEVDGICLRCYGAIQSRDIIRYDWDEGPVHPMCVQHPGAKVA